MSSELSFLGDFDFSNFQELSTQPPLSPAAQSTPSPQLSSTCSKNTKPSTEGERVKVKSKRRNRRTLSCENCRLRKTRCTREDQCNQCTLRGQVCKWGPKSVRFFPRKDEHPEKAKNAAQIQDNPTAITSSHSVATRLLENEPELGDRTEGAVSPRRQSSFSSEPSSVESLGLHEWASSLGLGLEGVAEQQSTSDYFQPVVTSSPVPDIIGNPVHPHHHLQTLASLSYFATPMEAAPPPVLAHRYPHHISSRSWPSANYTHPHPAGVSSYLQAFDNQLGQNFYYLPSPNPSAGSPSTHVPFYASSSSSGAAGREMGGHFTPRY